MPRFYFHIRDGDLLEIDPDGLEFATLEYAVLDARKAAREMLAVVPFCLRFRRC